MTHPLLRLQNALLADLRADAVLAGLVGTAIYESPPPAARAPDIILARHEVVPRDADLAPGLDHRLVLALRAPATGRRAVLDMAERVLAVMSALNPKDLRITHRRLESLDTTIDTSSREARARLSLRFFTETLQ